LALNANSPAITSLGKPRAINCSTLRSLAVRSGNGSAVRAAVAKKAMMRVAIAGLKIAPPWATAWMARDISSSSVSFRT
jgi:hypothetical protein